MRFSADVLLSSLRNDLAPHISTSGCYSWSIDSTPKEVACYRQLESLVKKLNQEDEPSEEASRNALLKFLSVNDRLKDRAIPYQFMWEEELVGEFKKQVYEFWYTSSDVTTPLVSDWTEVFNRGRTGPGASLRAKGTDLYTKLFGGSLSATLSISDIWRTLVVRNPQFSAAYSEPAWVFDTVVVDGNNLSFVNKTRDIARPICTEPVTNMWLQLGFGSILESRLRQKYGIDLSIQPEINRRLATIGSISNQLCTVDLESASDSMSLSMLRECLPSSFLAFLLKMRSPCSRLPDGSVVPLNMVSTMGNGFTFPLQTVIFTCAVVASYRYLGIPYVLRGPWDDRNVSVFGDDIIVDRRVVDVLVRLLSLLGFVVNSDKTYVEGPFRESCGVDVFLGVDVRPVYIKRLRSLQDSFVAINRLNLWSAKTGISLRNTVQYILACFPKARKYPVPPDEALDGGLHLPREHLGLSNRSVHGSFGCLSYTIFIAKGLSFKIDVDSETIKSRRLRLPYNPSGLFVAFLAGSIRGYRILPRQESVRYITKRRITPRWGFLPPQTLPGFPFQDAYNRFLFGCLANL